MSHEPQRAGTRPQWPGPVCLLAVRVQSRMVAHPVAYPSDLGFVDVGWDETLTGSVRGDGSLKLTPHAWLEVGVWHDVGLAQGRTCMAVEMAIWRMTDAGPLQLVSSPLVSEQRLEDMLAEDPGMCGIDLLVIGRQVRTRYGGFIDLLALDADGRAHVLELKRDRTPRDVVAQTLDYGSWVQDLGIEDLEQIYAHDHDDETDLGEAFAERFDSPLPDVVNADQQFTIIASELDPTSDRIVEFLADSYGVPINAVFFRHFSDGDRQYLARTWLLDPQMARDTTQRPSGNKSRPWNGRDFYCVLDRAEQPDRWSIARKYGLLSAGGGSRYWKPFRHLAAGMRVFAYVGGAGYVGIGRVTGGMIPARDARVEIDGQLRALVDQPELSAERWKDAASENPELVEMVVPVEWLGTRPITEAIWEKGLFSSQHVACKLRDENTIRTVESAFGLDATTGTSN